MKLITNRGPNFTSGATRHYSMGGTQEAYALLCKEFSEEWICLVSSKIYDGEVKSSFEELNVLFIDEEVYNNYYYGYISEYLYPNILGFELESKPFHKEAFIKVSNTVVKTAYDSDIVILGDYHLFHVSHLLKKSQKIIMFWFLPFLDLENNEAYDEISKGLLNAHLVIFLHHDYEYNFKKLVAHKYPRRPIPKTTSVLLGPSNYFSEPIQINKILFSEVLINKFTRSYQNKKYLLCVGRLDFVKKIPLLLKAISHLIDKKNELCVLIIAPHHRRNSDIYIKEEIEIDRLVNSLQKEHDISLIKENLTRDILRVLYRFSDILVLPSTYDAMPLVPLEYALANNGDGAIIVSETCGTAKIIPECHTFTADNEMSLAVEIRKTLYDNIEDKRKSMRAIKKKVSAITSEKWMNEIRDIMDAI